MYKDNNHYVVNGNNLIEFLMSKGINNTMVLKELDDKFFNKESAALFFYYGADIHTQLENLNGWENPTVDYKITDEQFDVAFTKSKAMFDCVNTDEWNDGIYDIIEEILGVYDNDNEDDNYESQELQDFEGIGMEYECLGSEE